MLRGKTIYLRLFEPEDFEKTYIWHNDVELQSTTCGSIRFASKEIDRNWVLSKSTNNQKDIYLAICVNETDEMIGWYSINNIDHLNRKCHCSGVIIGDKRYRDGMAYEEAGDLAFMYIINELNIRRVTGACLKEQILSRAEMEAGFWQLEGIERQSVYKNGKYHDICHYAILKDEFLEHLRNGDFDYEKKIRRLGKIIRRLREEAKNNTK